MMSSRRRFWGPQQRNNMRARQKMAPQPDQQPLTGGMTPNQVQQRTLPNSSPGTRALTGMNQQNPARRRRTTPGALPAYTDYLDELDLDKGKQGLSDPQVQWLKKNILGRGKGQRGPNEGLAFQRDLAKSIQAAGGLQAFIASMSGMPGVNRRQAMAREQTTPNTANVTTTPYPNAAVAPGRRELYQQPAQAQQAAVNQANWTLPFNHPSYAGQPGYTGAAFPGQGEGPRRPGWNPGPGGGGQDQPRGPGGGGPAYPDDPASNPPGQGGGGSQQGGQQGSPQGGQQGSPQGGQNQQRAARDRQWFIGKGIPLTPEFEESIRLAEDEFSATMHALGMDQKQIGIFLEQAKLRAMEDTDRVRMSTDDAAVGAGGFNSGVRAAAQSDVEAGFGRQMQDLAQDAEQKYADVATGRAQARMDRRAAIQEALLARAAQAEADPSSPIYSGPRRRSRGKNNGKRRKSRGN